MITTCFQSVSPTATPLPDTPHDAEYVICIFVQPPQAKATKR